MIYTLERRTESGSGTAESHYEVRSYTHRTKIGILANGKTLKKGTLEQCRRFCTLKGIDCEESFKPVRKRGR